MKQRSFCPGRLSTAIAIALCCFPPFSSGQENPGTVYQFNDGFGNDSNLLIVFYVQIMPDDFVMQL
ncbi:hypothetical protein KAF78_21950, partial [Klebsiella pneumoniae]|uniref:hypothetical protein n=1 Tax=Klebsiella pneumoniae TaxID=573 RepID=UPI001DAFA93E